jgi:galactose mutarotase-like enzyme
MSFSHRAEQRGDRLLDILTEEDAGLRLIVARLGAELVSVARRNAAGEWIGFLWRDDDLTVPASGWANHATVMGYFLHRLKDGRSLYRGREIRGGTHSFLRTKIWQRVEGAADGTVTYRMSPANFTPAEYPLRVSLDLSYKIQHDEVTTVFSFRNDEAELTAHLEFGLHPGFGASSFDSFQFRMPAGHYRRYFSPGNYLSGATEELELTGGEMPFAREQLPGSFILELVDVPNREFIFRDGPTGREVRLDLSGVPYLTLWSDGGAFLCVEPCWGLTDRHDQRAFEEKDGIQTIAAGGRLEASFTMKFRLAEA